MTEPTTIQTPADTANLTPGQWVFDTTNTGYCLVDTHLGWPQRMWMSHHGYAFTALDGISYPLTLADITDPAPCTHPRGTNECGHCTRCGQVVGDTTPMSFDPAGLPVVQAAAEHNARRDSR